MTSHSHGQGRSESSAREMPKSPISTVHLDRGDPQKRRVFLSVSSTPTIHATCSMDQSTMNPTLSLDQGEESRIATGNRWRQDNTHGSGVYMGLDPCLMYWVQWKTRKARPPRKSREESRPATGRRRKPVQARKKGERKLKAHHSGATGA